MMHLKEVNLGACGAFLRDLFLINLLEAFPNLQRLNINLPKANATIKWKIENLTLVLKTLAKVKNLKISNLEVYLERGNDESRDEILGFLTEALEITQKKFSEDTSDFKIQEDHYGFIISKEKLNFVKLNNCLKIDGHTGRTVNDVFLRMLPQQHICCNKLILLRTATVNFWEARPPQWRRHKWLATTAFYSAKSRQTMVFPV